MKYLFELVLTVWMFLSAVLYPVDQVGGMAGTAAALNPMTPIIEGYRDVLLRGHGVDPASFMITTAVSALFLVVAWVIFHRAEYEFAENV